MLSALKNADFPQIYTPVLLQFLRNGHTLRGKPPGVARTLEQRLADDNPVDPELSAKINIGFPQLQPPRTEELYRRLAHLKKQRADPKLEKLAKDGKFEIDLDKVREEWLKTNGPYQIRRIADFYKIFDHLFGDAYFIPRVPLDIKYNFGDVQVPVYFGNHMKPREAQEQPEVKYDASFSMTREPVDPKQTLWTLLMTNPDGHFENEDAEYVHWLVTNIPSNEVSKGECLAPYLQPFPPRGTGWQRVIFVLFKQEKKLDLNKFKISKPFDLEQRTFSTQNFYREFQDVITPAGLAFCQVDWDKSLTDFYHNTLNIEEPIYDYDWPEPYMADQRWFPIRRPFNLYMDRYRDPKQVNKEFLQRKLAETHPFEGPKPPLKFPNAHPITGVPSWWKTELKKARLGWGRINQYKN